VPLAIGVLLLLFGARGVARSMGNAMQEIWGIAEADRPRFPLAQLGGIALVLVIGLGFTVTTFLSGLASGAGQVLGGAGSTVGAVAVALALNFCVFWLGFRIATGFRVGWRDLRTGAALGAVCWQVLQYAGGYVVSHQLRRASELYGTFGIVLGLLTWLFVQAEVTLYAAEVDVVRARRLWPRSVRPSPGDPHEAPASGQGHDRGAEVPPPRQPAEPGRHAYLREPARWFARARRAVSRR
ncbi:MAG TPA: YihY/virulence factor BrkB family protein, partial [Trebonia sp.]|nr:YihY/virulence factor BrkB family protein [Trebonia sp.]